MITQRLELEGGYPDGLWACAGCGAHLESGLDDAGTVMKHRDDCPEVAASYEPFIAAEGWREDTSIRYVPESAVAEAVAAERERCVQEIFAYANEKLTPMLGAVYRDAARLLWRGNGGGS